MRRPIAIQTELNWTEKLMEKFKFVRWTMQATATAAAAAAIARQPFAWSIIWLRMFGKNFCVHYVHKMRTQAQAIAPHKLSSHLVEKAVDRFKLSFAKLKSERKK